MPIRTFERLRFVLPFAAALLAGCGDEFTGVEPPEPELADVAGDYSIAVTNRSSTCGFDNWQDGATTQDVPLQVTQDGTAVSATIGGDAGTLVALWLGSATFHGAIEDSTLAMTIDGAPATSGTCTYSIHAHVDAVSSGDFMEGTLLYTIETNGSAECGDVDGCEAMQDFNGTRPPAAS
jgi:hypothetical protein